MWAVRGGADDERAQAQSPDRRSGPRRHPAGRLRRRPALSPGRQPGHRQDHHGAAASCSKARRWANAASTSPFPRRSRSCGPAPQSHGWDLDDKIDIFEIVPPESLLDSRPAAEPALFLGPRAWRDDQAHLRCRRAHQGPARRGRFAVGNPPAGAELAALSSADPGAEALFRPPRRHRAAARRSHGRPARQDGAQRCRRRRPAGGDVARLRRRAAARCASSSIAPRASAAATTTSSSGAAAPMSSRGWSRPSTAAISSADASAAAFAGLDALAGRRRRARFEHPAARPGRRGQEPDHPAVRGPGDPRWRQGRDVHLRRGTGASVRSRQAARLRPRRPAGRRASGHHPARRGGAVARGILA